MARVDLTVRGGGIFGLSIAWEAVRRGAKVRLIETKAIGAGSSGGVVGALSPHVPENWNPKKAFQLDSLLMAEGWWAGVTAAGGVLPGYARHGRLQPLADAAAVELARARAIHAQDLWRGQAVWRVIPQLGVADSSGWAPISPSGWLVYDDLSARIQPMAACAALVAAIRSGGGEVIIAETVPDEGAVVWATGLAGLEKLSTDLRRDVGGGVKGQALAVHFAAQNLPQMLVGGLHIVPHADGTVAIGSTSELAWQDGSAVDWQVNELFERAVTAVPVLAGAAVVTRWAAVRPRAKSRAPLLGAWPGRTGHFVANGGFKIGFGMAPKVADVMVDLVLDGHDNVPEGFRL